MKRTHFAFKITIFLLLAFTTFAQIKIVQLPPTGLKPSSLLPEGISSFRKVFPLNEGWQVYLPEEEGKRTKVKIPLYFENAEKLVFEKDFNLGRNLLTKNLRLVIYGLNYSADFILNDIPLYRHTGGELPINIFLPPSALNEGQNVLKIIVNGVLSDKFTIPTAQRFLFPKYHAGILGDVMLEVLPELALSNVKISTLQNTKRHTAKVKFSFDLAENDSTHSLQASGLEIRTEILDNNFNSLTGRNFNINSVQGNLSFKLQLRDVNFWSPEKPETYKLKISLFRNGQKSDEIVKDFSVFEIANTNEGIFLNGKRFEFKGAVYSEPDVDRLKKPLFAAVKEDLKLIKSAGFNTVRFKFNYPQPFELNLCRELGLLPIVELPLQSPPIEFLSDKDFTNRSAAIASAAVNFYSAFTTVKIFGLGSSLLNSDETERNFIANLIKQLPENNLLKFASFVDFPSAGIPKLDLYGKEIFAEPLNDYFDSLHSSVFSGKIFISEVSYPRVYGHTNGYLNSFSNEAQAKYFSDLAVRAKRENTNGFVINSVFDYSGDFTSLYAGYSKENIYKIGITDNNRNVNSLTFRTLTARLHGKRIDKIPLGTKNNRSPVFFILAGLILGIVMGLLFNSKRQFREDATRSLLRPYNFFADIRDHRILSGVHTFILLIVLSGAHGLLITIILYFLRMNILLEKILIAFNSPALNSLISYFAWNPLSAFFILWAVSFLMFPVLAFVIKIASLFVKQKVFFSNIFFVTVWAFLPLTILLPLELVLHKILLANVINIYIYILLAFFLLWTIKRLFMGIYIIFDVTPQAVYFWGVLVIVTLTALFTIYFQATQSTFYYITTALKEYPLI